jgi:hypothetical protein
MMDNAPVAQCEIVTMRQVENVRFLNERDEL